MQTKIFLDTSVLFHYADPTSQYQLRAQELIKETWIISETVKEEAEMLICRRRGIYEKIFPRIRERSLVFDKDILLGLIDDGDCISSDREFFRRISNMINDRINAKPDKLEALEIELTRFFALLRSTVNRTLARLSRNPERLIPKCQDKSLIMAIHRVFKLKKATFNDSKIIADCAQWAVTSGQLVSFVAADWPLIKQKDEIIVKIKSHFGLSMSPIQLYFITEQIDEKYFQI